MVLVDEVPPDRVGDGGPGLCGIGGVYTLVMIRVSHLRPPSCQEAMRELRDWQLVVIGGLTGG